MAALCKQKQVVDRRLDRDGPTDLEYPWHPHSFPDPLVRVKCDCGDVMCEQNPILPRGPLQNGAIISAGEARILNANQIQIGLPAQ